jgi:hypothetical protein
MAPSTLSSSAVLVGVATAVWGTHKYGRLGAEQPETADVAEDEPTSDP